MKWNLVYFDDQIHNIECFKILLHKKFEVIGCEDSMLYSEVMQKYRPHAYLIDIHMPMPMLGGYELYQKIISDPLYNGCPIIFISGDISDENKLLAYNTGAVDFIARNMNIFEIEARLASKIRLFLKTAGQINLGNLLIDFESLKVFVDDELIDLTLVEMRILVCLFRNMPESLTRDDLLKKAWGEESVKPGTINTHFTSMKAKLQNWNYTIRTKWESVMVIEKSQ